MSRDQMCLASCVIALGTLLVFLNRLIDGIREPQMREPQSFVHNGTNLYQVCYRESTA